LRCTVLLTGALAAVLGLVMILTMPLDFGLLLSTGLLWSLITLRELLHARDAYLRYCLLRLDSTGKVTLIAANGDSQAATLLAGSIVLDRVAWLRIESLDGLRCAELMRGNSREDHQWRRLQVVWRHFGAAS